MDIKQLYQIYLKHQNVCTDTRKIIDGSIFFALKGERFDGNKYALNALNLGASFAVVDDETLEADDRLIFVEDVLTTLQELAKHHRSTLNIPVLGITGSNGKTTTKELCREVLKQKYNIKATVGNLNNHIGVPLTILDTRADVEFLIVEMGANHQGEIELLCQIADPDYVMITNIGKAHLEGFGGIEGVKKGKSEMYRYAHLHAKKIFINTDDEVLSELIPEGCERIAYSNSEMLTVIKSEPFLHLEYRQQSLKTNLYGTYNLPNIAFAIKLGEYFSVDKDLIIKGISNYQPENNRSQLEVTGTNTFIKDAYNANPNSMKLSLESFGRLKSDSKVVVLGDMLELGSFSEQEHRAILSLTQTLDLKEKIFVGTNFYQLRNDFEGSFFEHIDEAKQYFIEKNIQNSTILLKGSRGISIESILK